MKIILLIMLMISLNISAEENNNELTIKEKQSYEKLLKSLKCPKCKNQSIYESNSIISESIKNKVKKMLIEGKTEKDITSFFVKKYGDHVLLLPPIKNSTYILWASPIIVIILTAILWVKKSK